MLFNKTEENWKELNGYWTAKEILQQPATWAKTIAQVKNEKDAIKAFIERTTKNEVLSREFLILLFLQSKRKSKI